MLQTKKDVDRHVRSSLARLREDEVSCSILRLDKWKFRVN